MFTFNHLRPRLSISHAHGRLHARIAPENHRIGPWYVLLFAVVFVFAAGSVFLPRCLHVPGSFSLVCLLIFLVPLATAVVIVFFVSIWALFGVEEVIVQNGTLRWTKTAFFWKRRFETVTAEISSVDAITPWHSLDNRVEFTAQGRRYRIGARLLSSEARQLAAALDHVLRLP